MGATIMWLVKYQGILTGTYIIRDIRGTGTRDINRWIYIKSGVKGAVSPAIG